MTLWKHNSQERHKEVKYRMMIQFCHNIRTRRKQMNIYFDHTFHTEQWNCLSIDLADGNGFRKPTCLDRCTTIKCAGSALPMFLTAVSVQRKNTQLWSFTLEHNSWFCKFLMHCPGVVHPYVLQKISEVVQELFYMLWIFFLQKYLVPLKLFLCSEWWETSGFNAISGKTQYFTYNFLQYMVLSYFPWSMILGLSQTGLQCSAM